ncbi:MAG: ABC transporter ATP-binding protein [Clostridia bacterium]|nr:ABC transporter ATP-binding protein [Clostridia bacterium]
MVLEVCGVSKVFGNRPVLRDVGFGVDSGEILGFIGPNGAGKTTAIKVILGLLHPNAGSVRIFGHDIQKEPVKALSGVGAIIESPELYSYMSGYDNLMQFARIHGVGREKVMEAARTVGLETRLRDKVSKYSLGMRQRLGVAQAIMHEPGLLILDEPTNGLDPDGIIELRATLRNLAGKGVAILISSHLLSELEHICTSVCIIENGVIVSRRKLDGSGAEQNILPQFCVVTDNAAAAREALAAAGYESALSGDTLLFKAQRDSVPEAVRVLVNAGCGIFALSEKKVTIEDAYIQATAQPASRQDTPNGFAGGDFR